MVEEIKAVVQAMAAARTDSNSTGKQKINMADSKTIQKVNNIFESNNMLHTERITVTKKWLCRKGLQFLQTLTQAEKEGCNMI